MINNNKSELMSALWECKIYFQYALIFSIVVNLLSLAPVGYMKDVYGPVLNSRSYHLLMTVTLLLIGFLVVSGIVEWVRGRLLQAASVAINEKLGLRVFEASYSSYLKSRSNAARGALQDLKAIRYFIASPAMASILDIPISFMFILLVYLIHPRMGLVALCALIFMFVLGYWTELKVRPVVKQALEANTDAQMYIADSGANAQTIHALGMMSNLQNRWEKFQRQHIEQMAIATHSQALGAALSKFILTGQGSVVIGVGCWLFIMGELNDSGGSLIIASIIGGRAIQPLARLIGSWKSIVSAREAYLRLNKFLEETPSRKRTMPLPPPVGFLSVEDLTARAPGSSAIILSKVTFKLNPGACLAIMGPSGSGKSSLARLLVGVWPCVSGSVRLDNVDVHSWDKDELGPHLGYLPQDIELLDGSIEDNICRFGPVDSDALDRAIASVGLTEFVGNLPQGLQTKIIDGGSTLSGGQRQRLGIARAIYGIPRLVVLDEPNANLDYEGTEALYRTIGELSSAGSTVVIVTHKKDILPIVDRILILKDGRPQIFGPRDLVLDKLAGKEVKTITPAQAAKLHQKT